MNNPGPIIPSSVPKKKSPLAKFEKRIGYINALLLKLGLWVLILLSLGLLWREYHRSYYLIKPIEVPTALADMGYSPTVVSQRIFDELLLLVNQNQSVRDFQGFSADQRTAAVDFQVAGFGLSVQSLATQLRMAIGKTERIIQGEIVNEGEQLALRLRVPGKSMADIKAPADLIAPAIDSLTKTAAFNIFKFTEPYLYAAYLHAEDKIEECMKEAKKLLNNPEEKKWGLNLIANLEKGKGNIDQSIEYYKMAHADDAKFALPLRNLAYTYQAMDSTDKAIYYFEKSIALPSSPNKIFSEIAYYFLLQHQGTQHQKIESLRNRFAATGDSRVFSNCANQALNRGFYTEANFWSKRTLKDDPTNESGLIFCSVSAGVVGDKTECIIYNEKLKKFYPDNAISLVPDMLVSLIDKDYGQFNQVLDSLKNHHQDILKNSDGLRLFFAMQKIYAGDLAGARNDFEESAKRNQWFDVKDFKQLHFARDIIPALSDSLGQALAQELDNG